MRVGILTFHRALNYGAVLQAYALQRVIESIGVDARIIDYRCPTLESTYHPLYLHERSLKGLLAAAAYLPIRLARSAKFASFRRRNLPVSAPSYLPATIGEAVGHYDRFVVGSDQVWNPDLTERDSAYFLDFVSDPEQKVSYAASLGKSGVFDRHAESYLKGLTSFGAISVRERDAQEYLQTLLGRDVSWVLDPVLLADPEIFATLAASPRRSAPYIFAYCLHETEMYRYVEHLSGLTGLPVVYFPGSLRSHVAGTRVLSLSPEEFLGWIREATYVITDSFHVVAFSIVFRRVFKAQLKSNMPELNSRITSLLGRVGLERQVISEEDLGSSTLPGTDYSNVEELLAAARRESLSFLEHALGCEGSR